jgi:hypothetical protein
MEDHTWLLLHATEKCAMYLWYEEMLYHDEQTWWYWQKDLRPKIKNLSMDLITDILLCTEFNTK